MAFRRATQLILYNSGGVVHTATTAVTTKVTATVPADFLGVGGRIIIQNFVETNNNANGKVAAYLFGGTQVYSVSHASQVSNKQIVEICNINATNVQRVSNQAGYGGTTSAEGTAAIQTSGANVNVTITGSLGVVADSMTFNTLIIAYPTV